MIEVSAGRSIAAVDLFCGVGGLTHGLIRGGIKVNAGIDIDEACRFPFEYNNAAKFIERDVKKVSGSEISSYFKDDSLTLLAGCAPCQPFSTYSRSGRSQKRGLDWQLVSEFGRLIHEVQPHLVTMENVAQLADHKVFLDFLDMLGDYTVRWSIAECSALGVPQSRKRLVLLASRIGDHGLEMPSKLGDAVTVRDTISKLPSINAGETHSDDRIHVSSRLSVLNMRRIRASIPGGTWRDWDEKLRAECHVKDSGTTYPSVYGRMEWDKTAPTITTQCFGYGNGRFGHPDQDRAISLREAAMLQTFPQTYKFVSDGDPVRFNRLGRLIGNAVPVRLGEVIANVLVQHVRSQ